MCFVCSDEPVEDDIRKDNVNRFEVGMMKAPSADPLCCLSSCLCPCCAQIVIRKKALNNDMTNYRCCQGYFDGAVPCVKSGSCGEQSCPDLCLCAESFCCNGCAVSATRMMIMDRYQLQPDPWDNKIIRFNNCIQMLACVFDVVAICVPECRDAAQCLNCIANCTYMSTQGCMTAQANVELKKRGAVGGTYTAAQDEAMERV